MNNTVIISGIVERNSYISANGRKIINMTVKILSSINNKEFYDYIPVQMTMPAMVEKYKTLPIGTRVSLEGRFETYQSKDNKIRYNVTQLTSFQPIDQGFANYIMIWGHISSDIKIDTTQMGTDYASFNIANHRYYQKNDEWVDVTSFIHVNAWNDTSKQAKHLKKGDAVWVVGKLSSRSYEDKDKNKIYVVDITADSIMSGGSGKRNIVVGSNKNPQSESTPQEKQSYPSEKPNDVFKNTQPTNNGLPQFPSMGGVSNGSSELPFGKLPFGNITNNKPEVKPQPQPKPNSNSTNENPSLKRPENQKPSSYPGSSAFINLDNFDDDEELPFN